MVRKRKRNHIVWNGHCGEDDPTKLKTNKQTRMLFLKRIKSEKKSEMEEKEIFLSVTDSAVGSSLRINLLLHCLERKRKELATCAFVELVLEFDPVQTKRVEECRQTLHHHEHTKCSHEPNEKPNHNENGTAGEVLNNRFLPKHSRELPVGKGQSPQAKV
jgi:hypothetical protein